MSAKVDAGRSAHTPGPWRYRRTYSNGEEVGCAILPMGYDISTSNLDENEANAALIAAAPELLAACELLLGRLDEDEDRNAKWIGDTARAAIARATGQAV